MTFTLIVKQEAQNDLIEAALYYEEKQKGLGNRFINAVDFRYKQIAINPQHYSYISADKEKTLRSVKVKSFPYIIIYDFSGTDVIVYAVHNCYKNRKDIYE